MVLEFYDIYRNYNGYNIMMKRYLVLDGLMKKCYALKILSKLMPKIDK